MRGDIVFVRAFGNKPLVRRVWDEDGKAVYIADDVRFNLLFNGDETVQPIGFPREDIYEYDPELAKKMEQLYKQNKWDWEKLKRWKSRQAL